MKNSVKLLCGMCAFLSLQGCGDQHGFFDVNPAAVSNVNDGSVLPVGKNTIAFSSISTAKLAVPVSGIDLTFQLPAGMSVATTDGVSGPIKTDAVMPGAGMSGTNLAFGSYSVSTRKVYLSMATTSNSYRSGEFIRLVCTVAPGTTVTYGDIRLLNTAAIKKAVGYDSVSNSTVVLTGSLKLLMDLVR
jgi:hypothetical protein